MRPHLVYMFADTFSFTNIISVSLSLTYMYMYLNRPPCAIRLASPWKLGIYCIFWLVFSVAICLSQLHKCNKQCTCFILAGHTGYTSDAITARTGTEYSQSSDSVYVTAACQPLTGLGYGISWRDTTRHMLCKAFHWIHFPLVSRRTMWEFSYITTYNIFNVG